MTTQLLVPAQGLSDEALLARVKQLAAREREATVTLIAHLAELDRRRLYLAEGCSSLFTYCTQVLHLSEHAAYGRIEAARAARRFPAVLERLEDGSITLTTVCLLAAHFTTQNHIALLDAARHRSKREVEELVAQIHPRAEVPASIRRLPGAGHALTFAGPAKRIALPSTVGTEDEVRTDASGSDRPVLSSPMTRATAGGNGAPRAIIAPLAPQRYRVQFTASSEMYEKFQKVQALLRHQIPDGDPAAIIDRALTVLLEELERQKLAATEHPREPRGTKTHSRSIPAEVRREVWGRDGGRCAFVSSTGRRCTERGMLEFHHVVPFSAGGPATADNIQLRCRAHNSYEARLILTSTEMQMVREVGSLYGGSEKPLTIRRKNFTSSISVGSAAASPPAMRA